MNKATVSVKEGDSVKNAVKSNPPSLLSPSSCLHSTRAPLALGSQSISTFNKPIVQPKLRIGTLNDRYEQEADRIAEQVVRMSDPGQQENGLLQARQHSPQLQLQANPSEEENEKAQIQVQSDDGITPETLPISRANVQLPQIDQQQDNLDDEEEEEVVQANTAGDVESQISSGIQPLQHGNAADSAETSSELTMITHGHNENRKDEVVQCAAELNQMDESDDMDPEPKPVSPSLSRRDLVKGVGRPLSPGTLSYFEKRMGYRFDAVRIHTGTQAVRSANQLGARAFTQGADIVFGQTANPEASPQRHLLAHEIVHVVQQGHANPVFAKSTGVAPKTDAPRIRQSVATGPGSIQAAPAVTAVNAPGEVGAGRRINVNATVAAGTPGARPLTWSLVGAPAGVTINPRGRTGARVSVAAGTAGGGTFQVQATLTSTPADQATSANIRLVSIASVTMTPNPAFVPVVHSGGPAVGPANTAEPNNRDGYGGNTANAVVVTAPAGRATTLSLRPGGARAGAAVAAAVVTPGRRTGNITVRATDNATRSFLDQTLPVNPVPVRLNNFPAQANLAAPSYGVRNTMGFRSSDTSGNVLNRVVGETITAGSRDDLGVLPGLNGIGPNPAPIVALSAPANAIADTLGTSSTFIPPAPVPGVRAGTSPRDINNYVGPGATARLPRITILRQGLHHRSWTGTWGTEFDHGIHRRSLRRDSTQASGFGFRTEHIYRGARATVRNQNYIGPPLISFNAINVAVNAPAAQALAADGVARGQVTVTAPTVPGRNVFWRVVGGAIGIPIPLAGAAAPVAAAATVQAGFVPGRARIQVVDQTFPNRQATVAIQVRAVRFRRMRAAPRRVPAGVLTSAITLLADPGGRIVNWSVDPSAAAAGVTVVGGAVAGAAIGLPARNAVVTRPAGFTGRVTVTARDSIIPARSASVTVRFR